MPSSQRRSTSPCSHVPSKSLTQEILNLIALQLRRAGREVQGHLCRRRRVPERSARSGGRCPSLPKRSSRLISAQYVLPPGSVVFTGCVGDDELAEQLKAANKREGLDERYLVKKGERTGACAVVITGHDRYVPPCDCPADPLPGTHTRVLACRSLVTALRAAEKFEKAHLSSPEVAPCIESARVFYMEGFFLTHGSESALELSKKASEAGKVRTVPPAPQPLTLALTAHRCSC